MKRPDGFDRPRDAAKPRPRTAPSAAAAPTPQERPSTRRTSVAVATPPPVVALAPEPPATPLRTPEVPAAPRTAPRKPRRSPSPQREATATLKAAARARRREERAEVRRFTRRTRRRRVGWLVAVVLVVAMVAVSAALVYSPLFALRHIQIEGASRVPVTDIRAAVDGQVGTPLALVNNDTIGSELSRFPLIRNYSTEVLPPDTLVIRVVERQPVGVLKKGAGFDTVDPAGVVIASATARPAGMPLIELSGHRGTSSAAFRAITATLVGLPAALAAKVDSVTATSSADVTLTLTGGQQTVVWGTSSDSAHKAQVLTALINANGNAAGQYDVSASGSAVYRTAPLP